MAKRRKSAGKSARRSAQSVPNTNGQWTALNLVQQQLAAEEEMAERAKCFVNGLKGRWHSDQNAVILEFRPNANSFYGEENSVLNLHEVGIDEVDMIMKLINNIAFMSAEKLGGANQHLVKVRVELHRAAEQSRIPVQGAHQPVVSIPVAVGTAEEPAAEAAEVPVESTTEPVAVEQPAAPTPDTVRPIASNGNGASGNGSGAQRNGSHPHIDYRAQKMRILSDPSIPQYIRTTISALMDLENDPEVATRLVRTGKGVDLPFSFKGILRRDKYAFDQLVEWLKWAQAEKYIDYFFFAVAATEEDGQYVPAPRDSYVTNDGDFDVVVCYGGNAKDRATAILQTNRVTA